MILAVSPPPAPAPGAPGGAHVAAARVARAARRDGRHRRAGLDRPGGRGARDGVRLSRHRDRRRPEAGTEVTDGAGDEPMLGSLMLDRVLPPDRLPELLAESDFVVLAAPLTADTRGLIGEHAIAALKPGAWVINVARGELSTSGRSRGPSATGGWAAPSSTRSARSRCPVVPAVRPSERDPDAAHVVVVDTRPRRGRSACSATTCAGTPPASRWSTSSTRTPATEPIGRPRLRDRRG